MAERELPKLAARVRFSSPAPKTYKGVLLRQGAFSLQLTTNPISRFIMLVVGGVFYWVTNRFITKKLNLE